MFRTRRFILTVLGSLFLFFLFIIFDSSGSSNGRVLREPPPASRHPNYPPPTRLMDLEDFQYLANPSICEPSEEILAVMLVHTHPANSDLRGAMREHITKGILHEINVRRVFLVAKATTDQGKYPAVRQEIVTAESGKHQDLVQGNFVEHYRNLTYKHMMGLSWVTKYCPQAKFVIKVDDDIAVDVFQIRQLIRYKYRDMANEMLGLIQIDSHPLRNKESKWKVTEEEFQDSIYPRFLSGWCYIAPREAVQKIVSKGHTFPYFFIDDVFVTGIVAETLNIDREGLNHKYTIHTAHLRCCIDDDYQPLRYYCDYIAAPSGGDHQLLARALNQFRHCYTKGCQRRSGKDTIARSCVVKEQKEMPTGKGVGEVIPL